MEEFGFGMFEELLEEEPRPMLIDRFTDEEDYKRQLKEKHINVYAQEYGDTRLHRAIRNGKQTEINALLEVYREDFDKVRDHLVAKYRWEGEDKFWLRKTVLVAITEEECQHVKSLENAKIEAEDLQRAVFVLLLHPVQGEEVAVLHPNETNRSAVANLILALTSNGFLSWDYTNEHGTTVTFMEEAASRGLKLVIDRLYELGAQIAFPGHNPLVQAIRTNKKELVNWLLTEHFDHFDCTLLDSSNHNPLITAVVRNDAGLFNLVLEKMMAYRQKYFNETEEEAFHEIFRIEHEEYSYTSAYKHLRKDEAVFERLGQAIRQYKLKLSHQWKSYVALGRLIEYRLTLDYCFEGIRNDPQMLGLRQYETITVLHQLVSGEYLDFVTEMYSKYPEVKAFFNTDHAFEVLRKAIFDQSRDRIQFILEHHGDYLKSDMESLRDQVVCCQYYSKEFYEERRELLMECFPEFRESIQRMNVKAPLSFNNYGVEGSFLHAGIKVSDPDKLPTPYSSLWGSNGETLLHLAAEKDDKELFIRMLEAGCELDALDNDGNHPVHLVKSVEMLDLIIDRHPEGPQVVHRTNNHGCTVIHTVGYGHYMRYEEQLSLLEKLIGYGVNVHQLTKNGESVVFFAGNCHLMRALVKHGVQLDVINDQGETALERQLVNYNATVAVFMLNHLHTQPSFKEHAHKYLAPMMRYNRDFFSSDYQPFLEEHPDSARAMFDAVCRHSSEEASRLFAKACCCAFIYISEMFLSGSYDLNYNYKWQDDNTPLIGLLSYMEQGNFHLVKQLLEKEVDIHAKNCYGADAFLALAGAFRSVKSYGHGLETVQLLLDHGALINNTDRDGNTPLHLAFKEGQIELVDFLVQNGADLRAENNGGKRPIEMASKFDQELFYFFG